jgi:DNA polymerase-1
MSVGSPPLQQYPASVRRIFRFDEPATSMDWSSIEPVYFANVVGESLLIDRFEVDSDDKADYDLYMPIAEAAGVDRTRAKVVLLAQLYGQGAPSLGSQLGITEADAYELVRAVMATMPKIVRATEKIKAASERFGKIQTMSGRIVPQDSDPRTGNHRYFGYIGVNHLVQGSCYDLLAEAIYEMHLRGLDDALYMAVHDELVVATEAADEVSQIMLTPPPAFIEAAGRTPRLRVGRADLGRNWMEKQ